MAVHQFEISWLVLRFLKRFSRTLWSFFVEKKLHFAAILLFEVVFLKFKINNYFLRRFIDFFDSALLLSDA